LIYLKKIFIKSLEDNMNSTYQPEFTNNEYLFKSFMTSITKYMKEKEKFEQNLELERNMLKVSQNRENQPQYVLNMIKTREEKIE
jgi:hypothetical protein